MEILDYSAETAQIQHEQLRAHLLTWGFKPEELEALVKTSNKIFINGNFIGYYQFYKSISGPLFFFFDRNINKRDPEMFRLSLSSNMVPCIFINGNKVSVHLNEWLRHNLCCGSTVPMRERITKWGLKCVVGVCDAIRQEILIEVWNPREAENFIAFLNKEYVSPF